MMAFLYLFIVFLIWVSGVGPDAVAMINDTFGTDFPGFIVFIFGWIISIVLGILFETSTRR